ncbi:hypothetical protein BH10BAC3_BH10BAC3_01120 [soil metagenome]
MKKTGLIAMLFIPVLMLVNSSKSKAQMLSADSVKAQMLKDWERAKTYTIDYLNTMPTDKYSLKATDSVRSFAQQMLHLAQGNLFLMSTATDIKPPAWAQADLEHSAGAASKDSVMYYVTTSYDYCSDAVKNTDLSKWSEKKKVFGTEATRWALMMKTFEHQTHHRGQTTIYIRLAGVKPPQERLF